MFATRVVLTYPLPELLSPPNPQIDFTSLLLQTSSVCAGVRPPAIKDATAILRFLQRQGYITASVTVTDEGTVTLPASGREDQPAPPPPVSSRP